MCYLIPYGRIYSKTWRMALRLITLIEIRLRTFVFAIQGNTQDVTV